MSLKSDHLRRKDLATHSLPLDSLVYFKPQWQAEQAFRIIQRLPDNGSGLQYRIKSETDGREWITTEATLHEKAAATASSSSQT